MARSAAPMQGFHGSIPDVAYFRDPRGHGTLSDQQCRACGAHTVRFRLGPDAEIPEGPRPALRRDAASWHGRSAAWVLLARLARFRQEHGRFARHCRPRNPRSRHDRIASRRDYRGGVGKGTKGPVLERDIGRRLSDRQWRRVVFR